MVTDQHGRLLGHKHNGHHTAMATMAAMAGRNNPALSAAKLSTTSRVKSLFWFLKSHGQNCIR